MIFLIQECSCDMILFSNLKAYIFDLDGTLIDSEAAHLKAWSMALKHFVEKPDINAVQRHFGKSGIDIALLVLEDEKKAEKCVELKESIYEDLWPKEAKIMPCAKKLLKLLKKSNLKTGIASSNSHEKITRILKYFNLLEMIDAIVGLDDVREHKPSPELILKTLEQLRVKPSESVYIGDSPYDVLMAKRAGTQSILIKAYKRISVKKVDASPDITVKSLCDLYDLLTKQPFY